MTVFANVAGGDVGRRLPGCRNTVMTAAAVANNTNMIEVRGHPTCCRMTVIASITAAYVGWRLARCGHAIMTGPASPDDLSMIDGNGRREGNDIMAIFANDRGLNMCRVFAGRIGPVVATATIASDVDVVEVRRNPAHRGVAIVASIATRNMCRRLAGRNSAVVTGLAGPDNLSMIHHRRRCPLIHSVAILTHSRRLYMCDILACCLRTVVATGAIAGDSRMVEVGWRPADGRVAIITVVAAG